MLESDYVCDFKSIWVPSAQRDSLVHYELTEFYAARERTERELEDVLDNKTAEGIPLDPNRDIEPEYERKASYVNDLNRAMFQVYLRYLGHLPTTNFIRKRKADVALSATLIAHEPPPCPYLHIAELPSPSPTTPVFDPIIWPDTTKHALHTSLIPTARVTSVSAIADSGASHIIFRESDAHVLRNITYSAPA